MKKQASVLSATLLVLGSSVAGADVHLEPSGNDSNPGTEEKPFATIERARDAIRDLKKAGPRLKTGPQVEKVSPKNAPSTR